MKAESEITHPWFDIGDNDDGTCYVNAYWYSKYGVACGIRRDTIADELTEEEAQKLVKTLTAVASKLLLFADRTPLAIKISHRS